jgi:hypothetical protein
VTGAAPPSGKRDDDPASLNCSALRLVCATRDRDGSPADRPRTGDATRCGRLPFGRRGVNPAIIVLLATGGFCLLAAW